jgi:glycosyltransferase involved in cell wall biosynthesis
VDVLLRAFARAFRRGDDVALVVKSFPNIHNSIAAQLEAIYREDPDAPEIVHIDRDIPPQELLALYRSSHALVHPSRAEGFGFPVAEAMLLGLPVIAPSSTGLADFCTPETAFVIPHRWVPSGSHFSIAGAEWAEPDEDALVDVLRSFASGRLSEEAARRTEAARRLVSERFSAREVARAVERAIEKIELERCGRVSVGFVSTWNCRCGIASYTRSLIDALPPDEVDVSVFGNADVLPLGPDGREVERVWVQGTGSYVHVVNEALERGVDAVHIQFHPALFSEYHELSRAIHGLCDQGIAVFLTVHLAVEELFFYSQRMVLDDLGEALSRCERIFVHGERDLRRLSRFGLGAKLREMAHGGLLYPQREREEVARELGIPHRRVVASFGYAFPHKGVLEAIEAIDLLRPRFPEVLFLALAARRPEGGSGEYVDLCRERISELGLDSSVLLLDDFLSEAEIGVLLSAAEVVVLPYGPTLESASGAIRYPLACGRATITTREPIFEDVHDAVLQIPSADPREIAGAIELVLSDAGLRRSLEERAWRFAVEHSWPRVAREQLNSYRAARVAAVLGRPASPSSIEA